MNHFSQSYVLCFVDCSAYLDSNYDRTCYMVRFFALINNSQALSYKNIQQREREKKERYIYVLLLRLLIGDIAPLR